MATADTQERQYAYKAPTRTTSSSGGANEFGSNEMWAAMYPAFMPAYDATIAAGYNPNDSDAGSEYFARYYGLTSGGAKPPTPPTAPTSGTGSQNAAFRNAAQILLQLRGKDPYAGLRAALQKNAAGAQQTGDSAVAALRAALEARQNPYANVRFSTPMAAANPLAEYMAQSGAGTGQVDALRNLLQSWSSDAAAADQEMASRLATSWQNDQTSRLSDAATTEAAFRQALASNLASQQGALDSQYAQYQADLTQRLAELAMSSGLSLKDLGVTI